jgi:hypothetical protein
VKLILHIGTHKTGSTALQQFLSANPHALSDRGIHYAVPLNAIKASLLVYLLTINDQRRIQAFFNSHIELARRKRAHTLVVSAESFYGMALVPALCREQPCADLHDRDHVLINRLRASLPGHVLDAKVVCYFRRPDHFAESWYSQQVKYGSLFAGDFAQFLSLAHPALLYNEYMGRWVDVFGKANCTARVYESISTSIIDDFARGVLNITDLSPFVTTRRAVNERMSRDLLEFKRTVNRSTVYEEMSLERKIFQLLDESVGLREAEPGYYQAFLSPDHRGELLDELSDEMAALQSSFGLPSFPDFDLEAAKATWRPYPGLAPARRQMLERQYSHINRRVRFRVERFLARSGSLKTMKTAAANVSAGVAFFQRILPR